MESLGMDESKQGGTLRRKTLSYLKLMSNKDKSQVGEMWTVKTLQLSLFLQPLSSSL